MTRPALRTRRIFSVAILVALPFVGYGIGQWRVQRARKKIVDEARIEQRAYRLEAEQRTNEWLHRGEGIQDTPAASRCRRPRDSATWSPVSIVCLGQFVTKIFWNCNATPGAECETRLWYSDFVEDCCFDF